ncbi:MAG TPA: HD domain-containing protein [Aggregatilineales bacterium]|nr:HD domain-containing protein [Anaerolineales bacterium]HRE47680.1 HD domain-containing protein [Aggregatilineales bacterium]
MFTLTELQLTRVAQYVRGYLLRTADLYGHKDARARAQHRWMHTLNVLKNIRKLCDGEKTDADTRAVCEVAALFHDIDHYTVDIPYHGVRGAETAGRYLTKEHYAADFVKRVAEAVRGHHQDWEEETPIEAQIEAVAAAYSPETLMLIDAETLDKIGVSNLLIALRTLNTLNNRPVSDLARELNSGWTLQRAEAWFSTLITPTGKAFGVQRLAFTRLFFKQLEDEIVMYDPYPSPSQQTLELLQLPE